MERSNNKSRKKITVYEKFWSIHLIDEPSYNVRGFIKQGLQMYNLKYILCVMQFVFDILYVTYTNDRLANNPSRVI